MSNFPSFLEYLNSRGKTDEKPTVDASGDVLDVPNLKKPKKPKKQPQIEYINASGKLVEKPETETVPDYSGPDPHLTPMGTPYKAPSSGKNMSSSEKGLGDLGADNLKYNPDTKLEKTVSSWPKGKTESFLNKTNEMNIAEFTRYMLETCGCGHVVDSDEIPGVTAYTTGKIFPHPPEAIKYVVVMANKNDSLLDNMVHELKGTGGLGKLLKSILGHPEAYDELTNLFGDEEEGSNRCKAFANAMNGNYLKFVTDQEGMYESVAPPLGFDMDLDVDDDEESDPMGELSGFDDEDPEELEDPDEFSDEPSDEEDHFADQNFGEPKDKPGKKLKKKFAHHNMLDAMKEFGPMRDAMSGL